MMISRQKVMRTMDKLGYAESTYGTRLIRDAAELMDADIQAMMCKDIYPTLAKQHNMSAAAVEKAMRFATDKARRSPSWNYNWREIGGWNNPTNYEVVMRLVRECTIED